MKKSKLCKCRYSIKIVGTDIEVLHSIEKTKTSYKALKRYFKKYILLYAELFHKNRPHLRERSFKNCQWVFKCCQREVMKRNNELPFLNID